VPDDDVIVSALNQLRMEDVTQNGFSFIACVTVLQGSGKSILSDGRQLTKFESSSLKR